MSDSQKSTFKRIAQVLIFLLFLSLGAAGIYNVFKWKDTSGDYFSSAEQMYNLPKETVEVAFFGPSVVYSGINPAVFWEESGIASFNAAISGQDREAAYYHIKEFVKRQSPKVVVISAMLFQIDHYEVQGNIYRNTLSLRNSKNFVDTVKAIVPDNDKTEQNTVWDYYLRWPIIHSRYKEIKRGDFVAVPEYEKSLGYVYSYGGNGFDAEAVYFNTEIVNGISEENREWVDRIVELGREEGFEPVFVQIPGFLGNGQRADLNGCFKYLESIGVKYIDLNMCVDEMGYDYVTDMSDGHHPKASGAYKISSFLCRYLSENFALTDKRGTSGYELFDEAVAVSNHEKMSVLLADCDDLAQMFEIINAGDNLIYSVTLRDGSKGVAEETDAILRDYVNGREIWTAGGTAVFRDGLTTEVLGGKAYTAKLNKSEYLYVNPVEGGDDIVFYGANRYGADSGNFIVVYDSILDRLVVAREIY